MTIQNLRAFMKRHREFLLKKGVIIPGVQYRRINIVDVAGYFHRIITMNLRKCSEARSWDPIKYSLLNFVKGVVQSLGEGQKLVLVFDPIEANTESPAYKLKTDTVVKRSKQKESVAGLGYHEINKLKKAAYFLMKEEYSDMEIVCAQVEADIMVGSLLHKYVKQGVAPDDITVFSTDCDMCVFAYGCLYQDFNEGIDTTALFKLFGYDSLKWVAAVPEYLGCDYNSHTHQPTLLHDPHLLKREGQIYDVYLHPEKYEDRYDLNYTNEEWEVKAIDLFVNNRVEKQDVEDLDEKLGLLDATTQEEDIPTKGEEDIPTTMEEENLEDQI